METLPLSLKLQDAIKFHIKISGFPIFVGCLAGIYLGNIPLSNFVIYVIPMLIAVSALVIFITCKAANMTLTNNGFTYLNWRGKQVPYLWSQPVEVSKENSKLTGNYIIKAVENKKSVLVPKPIFSYPEVINFIHKYSPPNHKLRELAGNES